MPDGKITAETLAKEHKEISVAEFFERNKHLLGYENLQKSLLTCVRECVDNSLDACEDARVLPDIFVELQKIAEDKFKVIVEDNGPGIVKKNIPRIFGKLLFGSRFHKLIQSRGQQGIGVSAAVLYSQLTTGKPTKIYSRTGDGKTHIYELNIDIHKNEPHIISEESVYGSGHGTRIEMFVKGKYVKGKQSIPEYIKETAIMNPYSKIIYIDPFEEKIEFPRVVGKLPVEPKEIKPHPSGIELGILIRMLRNTKARNIVGFLTSEFSRISRSKANEMCRKAEIDPRVRPINLTRDEAEKLIESMQNSKIQNPPTNCLSPLTKTSIEKGLAKELNPEFIVSISRRPSVYRGIPFLIEVGISYGGNLDQEGSAKIMRFANKIPLLYEQSACAITKAVINTEWRRYGLSQSTGSIPVGPIVFLVHMASVWVPYTSEGKEAIASYPKIIKEVKLALQDAARQLGLYLGKKRREQMRILRSNIFQKYAPEVVDSLYNLTGEPKKEIEKSFKKLLDDQGFIVEDGDKDKKEKSKSKK